MIEIEKQELISLEVIRTLKSRFEKFPQDFTDNRNAPFHEAFLSAFADKLDGHVESIQVLISLSSWMHGLNTTLGQSFFENVAHILSDSEKRIFNDLKISQSQQTIIADIITALKNDNRKPNLIAENRLIFSKGKTRMKPVSDFTVDNFYEDSASIVAIELKTVEPNSGVFKVEKEKILSAKAALKNAFPNKQIKYYLGFPFDPLSDSPTEYNKDAFMEHGIDFTKYFAPEEVLLADELWNFLSDDTNTTQQILDIINSIATSEFLDEYNFINDYRNLEIDKDRFTNILERWKLLSELKIAGNFEQINSLGQTIKNVSKYLNQTVFDAEGKYKINRSKRLSELINT
ncbi:MAG: TdeIII family type II restriction endonuclease [Ignavibacteriales bacterium]|nr:TdeIII family type II restriction endonuclease [Ignavibacteriales bacterium]